MNALRDGLNASVFHSVSADRKGFKVGSSFESFCNLCGSKSTQTAVVDEKYFEGVGLFQIMKQSFGSIRVDSVVTDVKLDEIFTNESFGDVLDRLRDFLFKAGNENIVDVEVFDLSHEFEPLAEDLAEGFGV